MLVSVCCDTAQALVFLLVSVCCDTAQALAVFLLVSVCCDTAQALVFLLVSVCCDIVQVVAPVLVLVCRNTAQAIVFYKQSMKGMKSLTLHLFILYYLSNQSLLLQKLICQALFVFLAS